MIIQEHGKYYYSNQCKNYYYIAVAEIKIIGFVFYKEKKNNGKRCSVLIFNAVAASVGFFF